ncbi:putative zinc finger transcription factor protein 17, partial [Stegodyphus mimosarum]
MYQHIRKYHPEKEVHKVCNQICGLCNLKFRTMKELLDHIKSDHTDINLVYENKVFTSKTEFEHWKEMMEQNTQSSFIISSSKKAVKEGIASYYQCHRSGRSKIKESRKRNVKVAGSIKCGITCPAYIKVLEKVDQIEVECQSVHVGHKTEVGKLPLSKTEKTHLANLMKHGVPPTKVLSEIQKDYTPSKRLCITNSQDLRNIRRDFGIDKDVMLDKNDFVSVDITVRKLQAEPGNPVLIYKQINEELLQYPGICKSDFLLGIMNSAQLKMLEHHSNCIMIDSTHGTNQYGLNLTSVLVNDNNFEGFPVAILYSSKLTTETFAAFFSCIKERLPNLKTTVFMSDDAPAYYNAWCCVFGEADHHLLCSWHVQRAWFKNLNSKVRDPERRGKIKSELLKILKEVDILTFERLSDACISDYLLHDETRAFGEYLTTYMQRKKQWAYCYRTYLGINTNMKVERWHRQLKYEEAGGTVIKRLDKSLHLVLTAVGKKLMGQIISVERPKLTSRIKEIRNKHEMSKFMADYELYEIKPKQAWIVSRSQKGLIHTNNVYFEKHCNCNIRCHECDICIHQFVCSCIDYSVRFQICKHIHYVCSVCDIDSATNVCSEEDDLVIDVSQNDERIEEHYAITQEMRRKEHSDFEKEKEEWHAEFQFLTSQANTEDKKQKVREFLKTLRASFATSEKLPPIPSSSECVSEPVNKFIKHQRRIRYHQKERSDMNPT